MLYWHCYMNFEVINPNLPVVNSFLCDGMYRTLNTLLMSYFLIKELFMDILIPCGFSVQICLFLAWRYMTLKFVFFFYCRMKLCKTWGVLLKYVLLICSFFLYYALGCRYSQKACSHHWHCCWSSAQEPFFGGSPS